MGRTIAQKILEAHLLSVEMQAGADIGLKIDQTLTQDATGTMAYLEFEAMGVPRVKTEKSVAYIDHNTLQSGFENADDHRFIQSIAKKHGIYFSRPGNGICHQLHLERFGIPGKTLIGSDSHTPTGGGIGRLAFGAGGMDVAVASPSGYQHDQQVKDFAASVTDAKFVLTGDPVEAARDADVIFTDVWASMGQEQEKAEREKAFAGYQVNDKLMAAAKPDCMVQHCLPAHRGEEITEEVFEHHAGEIFDEAENRLHAQKAVMALLMK